MKAGTTRARRGTHDRTALILDPGGLRRALPAPGGAGPAAGGLSAGILCQRPGPFPVGGGRGLPAGAAGRHRPGPDPGRGHGPHPHPARPVQALAGGRRPGADDRRLRPVHGPPRGQSRLSLGRARRLLRRLFHGCAVAHGLGRGAVAGLPAALADLRLVAGGQRGRHDPGAAAAAAPVDRLQGRPRRRHPGHGLVHHRPAAPDLPAGHRRGRRDQRAPGQTRGGPQAVSGPDPAALGAEAPDRGPVDGPGAGRRRGAVLLLLRAHQGLRQGLGRRPAAGLFRRRPAGVAGLAGPGPEGRQAQGPGHRLGGLCGRPDRLGLHPRQPGRIRLQRADRRRHGHTGPGRPALFGRPAAGALDDGRHRRRGAAGQRRRPHRSAVRRRQRHGEAGLRPGDRRLPAAVLAGVRSQGPQRPGRHRPDRHVRRGPGGAGPAGVRGHPALSAGRDRPCRDPPSARRTGRGRAPPQPDPGTACRPPRRSKPRR